MADFLKLGVLISGSGSNLQSIIDQIERGALNARIAMVVSNNPEAYGLTRAQKHGIPSAVLNHQDFENREDFDRELLRVLTDAGVELVALAGFMRILSPFFLRAFPDRIINIHPALLPAFPGTHVQQKALDYGVRFSGCTVHFVDEGVDTGPIIIQAVVPVWAGDTAQTLADRILLDPLLALPLAGVNEDTLKSWYDREALTGKHQAARALMMFRGFLRWCAARPEYRELTDREAGKAAAIVESLPSSTRRTDALEAAQVLGWWAGVEQLSNRTASAYLRALLLTGARREELAALTWANVDFQWRKLTIADKVDITRTIPLSPYMAQMLATLPRLGSYVFASTGKAGRITDTRSSHAQALKHAGINHLTVHGLRRSFSLLGEAAGAPAGAIAQVMGHKPSATAEGYRPRSIDALRPFLEQIEAHILNLAGVQFDAQAEPGKLRAIN